MHPLYATTVSPLRQATALGTWLLITSGFLLVLTGREWLQATAVVLLLFALAIPSLGRRWWPSQDSLESRLTAEGNDAEMVHELRNAAPADSYAALMKTLRWLLTPEEVRTYMDFVDGMINELLGNNYPVDRVQKVVVIKTQWFLQHYGYQLPIEQRKFILEQTVSYVVDAGRASETEQVERKSREKQASTSHSDVR